MIPRFCRIVPLGFAVLVLRAGSPPPAFQDHVAPWSGLSLQDAADDALAASLRERLNPPRSAKVLHRAEPPVDHMPIARGVDIDPKMVHEPDHRYDYKLIIVPTKPAPSPDVLDFPAPADNHGQR